ncbi:Ribosome production factor 1 [Kappamyces sp. JEL0680]|nr:Ribosome production factor 1 [Kappamyces sp. JEL0680]
MKATQTTTLSGIKNKMKRQEMFHKFKQAATQEKLKQRMKTKKAEAENPEEKAKRLAENQPKTMENTREFDETIVADDEEVKEEQETDEFAEYFKQGTPPKILVTTSRRATAAGYKFATEFTTIFPDAQFVKRGPQFEVKRIVEIAIERNYTDVIIINEDRKEPSTLHLSHLPDAITMIHLPHGPTAYFKLTSVKLGSQIKGHGTLGPHKPELILNNFSTRLGHTIGRFFASLFPHVPEFAGRQACTLHNQRDFIFFRRHRYIFRNGEKVDIQEIGPRFTLKLQWLQKGTFDRKYGEYEWIHKPDLDTSRRRFHL